ncbi:shikimate dehydrogenase [Thiohalophilus sp.]|uniref:shikimate dehydrogenase n=1 Tax=Thiohalophilus sp. TaxID=3028392 RepID=UPI002ACDA1F3|nr:shikimate dehydrogenase [Thiohalophilus sp.]MDZ7803356.1 shikimate dehydrogenase [Thiohalophilus sp.]
MSDLFDFRRRLDNYAVMGNPVAHSKSPRIHSLFAEQTGEPVHYEAIQVDPGGFPQAVGNFDASGGKGLNITVPFKQEAWALVNERSERAERAGAVNTIKFGDATLYGDNTDGIGLVNDLLNNRLVIKGKRVLLMGAGGAARGVLAPLLEQQPAQLVIANRTAEKARELADAFHDLGKIEGCGYAALEDKQFDLVINATAASLQGELPPLPDNLLADGAVCYDMMYGAEPTPFMRWAFEQDATTVLDGLGMLVEQAAESFYIWRGVRPETKTVIEQLRREMAS